MTTVLARDGDEYVWRLHAQDDLKVLWLSPERRTILSVLKKRDLSTKVVAEMLYSGIIIENTKKSLANLMWKKLAKVSKISFASVWT
jgi:hypothetical protein